MIGELEAAAADWLKSLSRPRHKAEPPVGQPCANCGAELQGYYCHVCGQSADMHKRSIFHLFWEALEALFHFDGRLWRTMPLLFFRPGKLANDYIEGRMARHVPPFRTFLVALLLFVALVIATVTLLGEPAGSKSPDVAAEIGRVRDMLGLGGVNLSMPARFGVIGAEIVVFFIFAQSKSRPPPQALD